MDEPKELEKQILLTHKEIIDYIEKLKQSGSNLNAQQKRNIFESVENIQISMGIIERLLGIYDTENLPY